MLPGVWSRILITVMLTFTAGCASEPAPVGAPARTPEPMTKDPWLMPTSKRKSPVAPAEVSVAQPATRPTLP